jgi:hypothetical protein
MSEEFDSARWAANLKRLAELETIDSLGVRQVVKVADEIKKLVGRWGVFDEVCFRVARAIVEPAVAVSATRVGEVIETIIVRRRLPKDHDYYIAEPGRYFVRSMMGEFKRAGIPWNWRDRQRED